MARLLRLLPDPTRAHEPGSVDPPKITLVSLAAMAERAQSLQRTAPSWRAKVQCSSRRRFADGVLAHVRTPGGPTSSAQPLFRLTRSPLTPCRCPSLTRSNRRGTDPYARWWGRGGTARCPPIPISDPSRSLSVAFGTALPVESPGGVSPPGAPRSVREPLDSYGSRCSAVSMAEPPVGKEHWICSAQPVKPVSRPLGLATQPLELAARPADDIEIDPLQGRTQLRLVEVAVVVDPAANARVVHLGQVLQGLVTAMMKRPAPNCSADGRQRFRTGGGQEARTGPTYPSPRFPRSERKPEKVERLVRKVATAVRILAVDDLRLLGMQHQ